MTKEARDAINTDTTQRTPLWLTASTHIPPGPSGYMVSVVSTAAMQRPDVVGKVVEGILTQYMDEYPVVNLDTLVLTIEPDGAHHRLVVQTALGN